MQKSLLIVLLSIAGFVETASAQQKLTPGGMTYLFNPKPNMIIYHDSVFSGVKQFRPLFYRHHDMELIQYLERHQSNKIAGQIIGVAGTIAIIVGIGQVSSNEKGLGWALIGGGLASTLTSGYPMLMSQRNLASAITLFNQRHNQASLGIGFGDKSAGLVYKF